ncbi:MAG TPA: hypothetical protein VGK99_22545 [Acidobacteriota bacterium]|jgi:hypothetical protein
MPMTGIEQAFYKLLKDDREMAQMLMYRYGFGGFPKKPVPWIAKHFRVTSLELRERTDEAVRKLLEMLRLKSLDFEFHRLEKANPSKSKKKVPAKGSLRLVKKR